MADRGVPPSDDVDAAPAPRRDPRAWRLVAVVVLTGLLLTTLGVATAVRTDRMNEQRLLQVQTKQAATLVATAVATVEVPLASSLDVAASVLPERRREVFADRFSRHAGEGRLFASGALVRRSEDGGLVPVQTVGTAVALRDGSAGLDALLRRAWEARTFVVEQVDVGDRSWLAFALADRESGFLVHAERALPDDRRVPEDENSPYGGLDYAVHLGPGAETARTVVGTNVDIADLPLGGLTYATEVPFADTVLTLETRPREHLGSPQGQRVPWIVALVGLVLTLAAVAVTQQVLRSRSRAEADTATITDLYEQVDALYREQRDVSIGLQRALLPRTLPELPGLQVAAEYVAGAQGIDIGGDWYSVIGFDDGQFAFVVGDVSGHGLDAVAEMARARFTVRAYLVDGDLPEVALEKCSHQFDVLEDGHMVTVLAGVGSWRTGEVTVACAGHPAPLLVGPDEASFLPVPVGAPLGVGPSTYASLTLTLPTGTTLVSYTDGLVERRGEDIETGLDRLVAAARDAEREDEGDPAAFVRALLERMRHDDRPDDVAVLALRRTATVEVAQDRP